MLQTNASAYARLVDDQHNAEPLAADHTPHTHTHQTLHQLVQRLQDTHRHKPLPKAAPRLTLRADLADEAYLLTIAPSVPPTLVRIRADAATAPPHHDVRVRVPKPDDVRALLERTLSPVRALATRRLRVSGNVRLLASLRGLFRSGAAAPARVHVRVLRADVAVGGHARYRLLVSDGAGCWLVWRRWRELKALHASLSHEYGASSPLGLPLPPLPRSVRSSTSEAVLLARSQQIPTHLAALLELLPCRPRDGVGPAALVAFLGGDPASAGSERPAPSPLPRRAPPALTPPGSWVEAHLEEELDDFDEGDDEAALLAPPEAVELFPSGRGLAAAAAQQRPADAARTDQLAAMAPAALLTQGRLESQGRELLAVLEALGRWRTLCVMAALSALCAGVALALVAAALLSAPTAAAAAALSATIAAVGLARGVVQGIGRSGSRSRLRVVRVLYGFGRVYRTYRRGKARISLASSMSSLGERDPAVVRAQAQVHSDVGELLFTELSSLGGLWVKLGQYLATRADIMPAGIVGALKRLLDSNPPRPLSEVLEMLAVELDDDSLSAFASFKTAPISTASIAQVHEARLISGERVAVKVQHRGIEQALDLDLRHQAMLARLLAFLEPNLPDMRAVLREVRAMHEAEVDFCLEARNMVEIDQNLRAARCVALLPTPVRHLSTRRVIVMAFMPGTQLTDAEGLRTAGIDLGTLYSRIADAWSSQLFRDGIFHCDPHPGNFLALEHAEAGSVPVVLDFGMVKRLTKAERLALCRGIYAIFERDADALLDALGRLGLRIASGTAVDPLEVIRGVAWSFRDTEGDVDAAHSRWDDEKAARKRARRNRRSRDSARGDGHRPPDRGPPIEGELPAVLLYFSRTVWMLQGLATNLGASAAFLEPMAAVARAVLLNESAMALLATPPLLPPSPRSPVGSSAESRVARLLFALADTGQLLGGQVAAIVRGQRLIDVCAGRAGPVDARPVRTDSLFQIFEASAGLLALLALQEVERGALSPDAAPIASAWPAFGEGGKGGHTLTMLLSHRSELTPELPPHATVDSVTNSAEMIAKVAASSVFTDEEADRGVYGGAPFGWGLAGLLWSTSNERIDALLDGRLGAPLGVHNELVLALRTDEQELRSVQHSVSGLAGDEAEMMLAAVLPTEEGAADGGEDDDAATAEGEGRHAVRALLEKLLSPSSLNLRAMRRALLPGASAHASAHALARVYDAVGSGVLLQKATLAKAAASTVPGVLGGDEVTWALGLQLGRAVAANGTSYAAFGHRAACGAAAGVCVPALGISVAVTVSRLTDAKSTTSQLLGAALRGCGVVKLEGL